MRLSIAHRTAYQYDAAVSFGIQYLRLTPYANASQRVIRWTIDAPGPLTRWTDAFGNSCDTLILESPGERIEIVGKGRGRDDGHHRRAARRAGRRAGGNLSPRDAADRLRRDGGRLCRAPRPRPYRGTGSKGCTASQTAIRDLVDYREGATDVQSSASEVLRHGSGVCQDHAHVFIAVCRALGIPARYISGYLHVADRDAPEPAGHAWAAAWVDGLGWVSFDVANRTCGTESYVGSAIGLDYDSACPVRGIREGGEPAERLSVSVDVKETRRAGS